MRSDTSISASSKGATSSPQKPPVKSVSLNLNNFFIVLIFLYVNLQLRQLIAEGRNKALRYSSKKSYGVEVMDHYEAVNNYKQFQEKKTGYIEQESTGHYCIWDRKYPENPERVACARRR